MIKFHKIKYQIIKIIRIIIIKNIKIMNLMTAHLFHTRKMKSLIVMEAQDMDMNKIAVTYKKL